MEQLALRHLIEFRNVPDFDRAVAAPRDEALAVRGKRQAAHEGGMAAETADERARMAVPDADGAALARGGDPPAVGAEGQRVDVPAGPFEGGELELQGLHIPDLDRVFLTP